VTAERFADLATAVRTVLPRLGETRLVAVDGPSGAGKTWFAGRLGAAVDAQVVHTDDLLDGWDDQFTFWHRLEEQVLRPLRAGRPGGFRRYDWLLGGFGDEVIRIEPADVIIIEGVSAARAAIRPELSLAVFLTAPGDLCVERVVTRDGGHDVAFAAYFERWRLAEQRHFTNDDTAAHADVLVDGASAGDEERYERLWRLPAD
jgi:uridine kinase